MKHKNVEAARQLAGLSDFVGAVESVLSDPFGKTLVSEAKLGLEGWSIDRVSVALQIVELRGQLRHHSIGNPSRWKLSEQQRYRPQSVFLGSVCQHIAMPMSFGLTWEDQYTRGFMEQAESVGFITEVAVLLTINEGALPREVALNFRFPQYEASPLLAKTVLEHSMAEFDKRSPGSQLLGIRARVKPNGPELFRYDLGPAIRR